MKNIINTLKVKTFLYIMVFIAIACSKSNDPKSNGTLNETADQKSEPIENIYHYKCSGNCQGGGECTMTVNYQENYVECDCEGCTLIVTIENAGGGIDTPENQQELIEILFAKDMFLTELDSYIEQNYSSSEFTIDSIEFVEYGTSYYLLYDFQVRGLSESVMYACYYDDSEQEVKKYEIDCRGSCDGEGETCRERFIFEPPSAECTCESDNCTMLITQM